jgi:tetratricopeptide (TPR) repeat protein
MSDSLRSDDLGAADVVPAADRDAKIEQLLVAGLDHYFAARYDQAINVWTRALFLDRSHPRARAYIERARSALAERFRESEELLQRGVAAFEGGDREEARRLLRAAIDAGAPADEAHVLLDRLTRNSGLDGVGTESDGRRTADAARPARAARTARPAPEVGGKRPLRLGLAAAAVIVAAVAAGTYWLAVRDGGDLRSTFLPREVPAGASAGPPARDVSLPLPRRGEMALIRARSLAASGHLHEALAVLDQVRSTDPQKPEADRARADIQRQLLGLVALPPALPASRGAARGPQP